MKWLIAIVFLGLVAAGIYVAFVLASPRKSPTPPTPWQSVFWLNQGRLDPFPTSTARSSLFFHDAKGKQIYPESVREYKEGLSYWSQADHAVAYWEPSGVTLYRLPGSIGVSSPVLLEPFEDGWVLNSNRTNYLISPKNNSLDVISRDKIVFPTGNGENVVVISSDGKVSLATISDVKEGRVPSSFTSCPKGFRLEEASITCSPVDELLVCSFGGSSYFFHSGKWRSLPRQRVTVDSGNKCLWADDRFPLGLRETPSCYSYDGTVRPLADGVDYPLGTGSCTLPARRVLKLLRASDNQGSFRSQPLSLSN